MILKIQGDEKEEKKQRGEWKILYGHRNDAGNKSSLSFGQTVDSLLSSIVSSGFQCHFK